jgi:outer membrane lipoprotein-sorting protein
MWTPYQVTLGAPVKLRATIIVFLCCGLLCLIPPPAYSESIDGTTLAQRVFDRDVGKDSHTKVQMLLIDKQGKKIFRTLEIFTKDYGNSSKKSYTRFTSPASIEGTAFLTWENKDAEDDQFLYLPDLQRVRRIVSSQKSSRFVNTDYTYEDFQSREVDKDNHRILREETYLNYDCWVLESIPKDIDEDTQYGKRTSWIIKQVYLPIKAEYFDKNGNLVKIFSTQKIKQIDGIWSILESEMKDLERDHRTLMRTDEIQYNTGIPDRVFTQGYMLHNE